MTFSFSSFLDLVEVSKTDSFNEYPLCVQSAVLFGLVCQAATVLNDDLIKVFLSKPTPQAFLDYLEVASIKAKLSITEADFVSYSTLKNDEAL